MATYTADKILALRRHLEADGADNPDQAAILWAAQGWTDPSAAYREWGGLGATNPDRAWELRQAGLGIESAAIEVEAEGVTSTLAAHYNEDRMTLEEVRSVSGADPLGDLRMLAARRDETEATLAEVRRLARAIAVEARGKGESVADIAEAFGVSRRAAYDMLEE